MSKILLRSLSQEGEIVIPNGKTTIGRGPFLTVTDKRVSRSHALLDVSLNTLTITPVHVNPTFFKSQNNDKFVPLIKGETKKLQNGNIISLLPDKLAFQVVIEGSKDQTNDTPEKGTETVFSRDNSQQNQQLKSSTQESHFQADRNGSTLVKTTEDENLSLLSADAIDDANTVENSVGEKQIQNETKESCKTIVQPAAPLQKTRVLPSWMRKDRVTQKDKHQTKLMDKEKIVLGTRETKPKKTHQGLREDAEEQDASGETDDEEDIFRVKKKNISRSKKRKFYDSDENVVECEEEEEEEEEEGESPKPNWQQHEARNNVLPAGEETKENVVKKSSLPSCPYGNKCYRKNPVHFREYSHPSDEEGVEKVSDPTCTLDSNSEDEVGLDDRPHCQYGMSCYRKNPQHRKDFKHTRASESARSKRPTADKKKARKSILDNDEDDLGEENTYDYDDSFLDNESLSSESSSYEEEDSDWRPDNDEEDLEEDVNELVAEARGFLRRKKR